MARRWLLFVVLALILVPILVTESPHISTSQAAGQDPATPQGAVSPTGTTTETATATETATESLSSTPSETSTPSVTATSTLTATATKTRTPTRTPTKTPTRTPTPVVPISKITVSLSCNTAVETIRIVNNANWKIQIYTIGTLYQPWSDEPWTINRPIYGYSSKSYSAGPTATVGQVLTNKNIFTNSAGELDGVRITTNIGTITKRCPPVSSERWIEVDLSQQRLWAWEGNEVVNTTLVSTGKPGFDTPTGTFYVLTRYRYQTMSGCLQGECYYVPDVPYVQYFTNVGHALHGAYWHNDFGHVRSHGCVNLPVPFAAWLWDWATYGTRVVIHY